MKKKIINITILATTLFFSACSDKQTKLNPPSHLKKVSMYKSLGITEPILTPITTSLAYQNKVNQISVSHPTQDIEYISYRHQEPQTIPVTQDIEYISYAKKKNFELPKREINTLKTPQNIEFLAKSFLGVPYVWGATGPSKFDCSGFTQWVYRDAGIKIPRVSREQARVGDFVTYEQLQKGDMVFFDTKKHRSGRVCHVGIYLGDGNFIHASSAGKKVVIYNFNKKPFYKKRFLWGRRVIHDNYRYASN